jgi:hypothetical protein
MKRDIIDDIWEVIGQAYDIAWAIFICVPLALLAMAVFLLWCAHKIIQHPEVLREDDAV